MRRSSDGRRSQLFQHPSPRISTTLSFSNTEFSFDLAFSRPEILWPEISLMSGFLQHWFFLWLGVSHLKILWPRISRTESVFNAEFSFDLEFSRLGILWPRISLTSSFSTLWLGVFSPGDSPTSNFSDIEFLQPLLRQPDKFLPVIIPRKFPRKLTKQMLLLEKFQGNPDNSG